MKKCVLILLIFNFSFIVQSIAGNTDSIAQKEISHLSDSLSHSSTEEVYSDEVNSAQQPESSSSSKSSRSIFSKMIDMLFRFESQSLITFVLIIFYFAYQNSRASNIPNRTVWNELTPSFKKGSGFREMLLFAGIIFFYKWSRYIAIGDADTAFSNAYSVVNFEKSIGIFYEIPIQQFFLQKETLIKVLNKIYVQIHIPVTLLFFIWLFYKRKAQYPFIRNGFMIANVIVLFFFVAFPCAPPRMLNDLGFVDTLLVLSDINLYEGNLSKLFNQYAAVPSMHFGNAALIALVTFWLAKSKIIKLVALLYPWFILLVIVATGNHFFVDAIVGGIVVLFPYPLMLVLQKYFPNLESLFWGR